MCVPSGEFPRANSRCCSEHSLLLLFFLWRKASPDPLCWCHKHGWICGHVYARACV